MAVPDQTVLKTSTTYIEAQPGVEFRVEYSSLRPKGQRAETDIAVALDVDGVRMGMQRVVRCFDVDVGEQRIARFEGHRTSSTTIQPFVFTSELTGSSTSTTPGKIELKFYRVKIEGVNLQPKFIPASSSTSLGSARAATQKEHLKYTWIDNRDSPCEIIEFVYVSRSQLVQRGLIPSRKEEKLVKKAKAASVMDKRMKALETTAAPALAQPRPKSKPSLTPTFVPASIPEPSLTVARPASPPSAPAPLPQAEATEPEPRQAATDAPFAPSDPATLPRWLPSAGWRASHPLVPQTDARPSKSRPVTFEPLASTAPASSPSSDRLLITRVPAEARRREKAPSPVSELRRFEPVATDSLPTPAPSPPAPPTSTQQPQPTTTATTNAASAPPENHATPASQRPLPRHLRSDPQRIRPDTPPRRTAATRPAPVSSTEDVKPQLFLPTATPPKPSRLALASLGANNPSPLRPRAASPAHPSPRTRCTQVEAENARLRLEIAELENTGLKRRLKELREEADRGAGKENEVQKRRKVKGGKSAIGTIVLD